MLGSGGFFYFLFRPLNRSCVQFEWSFSVIWLALDKVSHTQQKSLNPWIGLSFVLCPMSKIIPSFTSQFPSNQRIANVIFVLIFPIRIRFMRPVSRLKSQSGFGYSEFLYPDSVLILVHFWTGQWFLNYLIYDTVLPPQTQRMRLRTFLAKHEQKHSECLNVNPVLEVECESILRIRTETRLNVSNCVKRFLAIGRIPVRILMGTFFGHHILLFCLYSIFSRSDATKMCHWTVNVYRGDSIRPLNISCIQHF